MGNGFCPVKELDEDGSKTSDEFKSSEEETGLGQGEGSKDVSDQIDNEDMLDGAYQNQEDANEEEDQDNKEEDNGIEMSDNFESNLQDKKEDDKNDEEDEKDDNENKLDWDKERGVRMFLIRLTMKTCWMELIRIKRMQMRKRIKIIRRKTMGSKCQIISRVIYKIRRKMTRMTKKMRRMTMKINWIGTRRGE